MKRFIIIAVLWLSCATVFAQWENVEAWNVVEPKTVESGHKYQWYEDQACAWQKVVSADPKNETAWRNLFLKMKLHGETCFVRHISTNIIGWVYIDIPMSHL